ncbi:MAG: NTP transferase domain-containing protein [Actinomycetota bacterium]|nr:NTP transferase domain-containing protein [Actinomycetota bacterium]
MTDQALPSYGALVLAGGGARRLGGADKPSLDVGGRSLLQRVVDAVPDAEPVVVVGPERPLDREVVWTREDPPGGGPVAALVAGLPLAGPLYVAVLAADLPFLVADVVHRLRAAAVGRDGALLVDDDGREQLLVGVWRAEALRDRLHDLRRLGRLGHPPGGPLRRVLAGLDSERVRLPGAARPPWWDCDTADDLDEARRRA